MTCKIGMPVAVHGVSSNGHGDQPGMVSAVHSYGGGGTNPKRDALINAVVFPDCGRFQALGGESRDCTSIPFYEGPTAHDRAKSDGAATYAVAV